MSRQYVYNNVLNILSPRIRRRNIDSLLISQLVWSRQHRYICAFHDVRGMQCNSLQKDKEKFRLYLVWRNCVIPILVYNSGVQLQALIIIITLKYLLTFRAILNAQCVMQHLEIFG